MAIKLVHAIRFQTGDLAGLLRTTTAVIGS